MDSELANDRTYLAWLRTGIALFGLGFVVAKVALIVQPNTTGVSDKNLYSAAGVLIVLSGAALIVVGYLQHKAYCIDVLTQISAVTKALQAVALALLDGHLSTCVADAIAEGGGAAQDKIAEASAAVARLVRS